MEAFYTEIKAIATSKVADIALIRSHIAYHAGNKQAEQASIQPSRGHSYKVNLYGKPHRKQDWKKVTISDYYDHRTGVHGIFSESVITVS
jgi:hypothetical protein